MRAAVVIAVLAVTAAAAEAEPAARDGFTLSVGLGVGHVRTTQLTPGNINAAALTPLSLGIGGFISDRVALVFRTSTFVFAYTPEDTRVSRRGLVGQFIGGGVQTWLARDVSLEVAAGLTAIGEPPFVARLDRGLGLPLRLSWSFRDTQAHAFRATWELIPTRFEFNDFTVTSSMVLEWQWL